MAKSETTTKGEVEDKKRERLIDSLRGDTEFMLGVLEMTEATFTSIEDSAYDVGFDGRNLAAVVREAHSKAVILYCMLPHLNPTDRAVVEYRAYGEERDKDRAA